MKKVGVGPVREVAGKVRTNDPVRQYVMTLYGAEGILNMPSPDNFGGEVKLHRKNTLEAETLPCTFAYEEDIRGLGVSDMAHAMEHQYIPRTSKEMANHALELLEAIVRSSQTGQFIQLESTFNCPDLMPEGEIR